MSAALAIMRAHAHANAAPQDLLLLHHHLPAQVMAKLESAPGRHQGAATRRDRFEKQHKSPAEKTTGQAHPFTCRSTSTFEGFSGWGAVLKWIAMNLLRVCKRG